MSAHRRLYACITITRNAPWPNDDDRNERSKTYAGQTERSTPGEAIVELIRRTSFPLSEFHAPHLFDYHLDDKEYHHL